MSDNPYAAPLGPTGGANQEYALRKVSGPALGLMIVAGIGMALQALSLLANLLGAGMGAAAVGQGEGGEGIQAMFQGAFGVVMNIVGLLIGALILVAATKMKRLESYSLAFAASVLAILPCVSPCCVIGLPVGIWSLIVLNDTAVKTAFRS